MMDEQEAAIVASPRDGTPGDVVPEPFVDRAVKSTTSTSTSAPPPPFWGLEEQVRPPYVKRERWPLRTESVDPDDDNGRLGGGDLST